MTRSVLQLVGPSEGGIRRHVAALAADLTADGWTVEVAAPMGVLDGAHVVPVPTGMSPTALRNARRALRSLIADNPPAVLHAHGLKAGWVAIGVDRRRTVLTVHNVVLRGGPVGLVSRLLERWVVRRSTAVIATSHEIARRFERIAPGIVVVEPVHDVAAVHRDRDDVRRDLAATGHLAVAVGRLHRQKSMDVLIRAWAVVGAERPGALLAIAGDGPEREALERLVDQLSLGASVRLLGARDDAIDLMAAADVVVFTSSWESGPLTLLEAGTVAAPVVITPVGFVPEIVTDGEAGRIVPIGDVDATAQAIMAVMDDGEASRAMGRRLRDAVTPRLDRAAPRAAIEAVYVSVTTAVPR